MVQTIVCHLPDKCYMKTCTHARTHARLLPRMHARTTTNNTKLSCYTVYVTLVVSGYYYDDINDTHQLDMKHYESEG